MTDRQKKAWICRIASNKCVDYPRATATETGLSTIKTPIYRVWELLGKSLGKEML